MNIAPANDAARAVAFENNSGTTKTKFEASEGAWARFLESVDRLYQFTLNWMGSHPLLTVAIFLVIGWWRWQAHLTKVQIAGLKSDYQSVRARARGAAAPQNRRGGKGK